MAWSAITKYMRTVCQVKCKPVEFPNFGIFVPVVMSDAQASEKLTEKALAQFNPADMDVSLLLNANFLKGVSGLRIGEGD